MVIFLKNGGFTAMSWGVSKSAFPRLSRPGDMRIQRHWPRCRFLMLCFLVVLDVFFDGFDGVLFCDGFSCFFWWFLEKVFDLFDGWSQLSRWSTEISPTKEHHEVHGSNLRQKFSWFDHIPPGKWLQVGWDLARTWHLSGRSPFSPAVAVDGYRSPSRNGRFQLSSPPLHC